LIRRFIQLGFILLYFGLAGCGWFHSGATLELSIDERPRLAILPFGIEVKITRLSSLKSVEEELFPDEENRLVAQAVQEVLDEARWLLMSNVAAGQSFKIVSLEKTDTAVAELHLQPGEIPTLAQLTELRARLGADFVLIGSILDYGKVRWQWSAAGMMADLSIETIAIGLARAWNPSLLLANVGYEVLINGPIWFGGGYLFGAAFRPVRVEARVLETVHGEPIWQDQEVAIWSGGRLKQFPEAERSKKENQLYVNLSKAMEELGNSLTGNEFTVTSLRKR